MTTLTALENVVDRHGRDALSDPIVLTGALRSLPDPPPDAEISALAAAAGAAAPARMRAVLENGGGPAEALRVATAACGGDAGAEWACGQLGAALGYLPRDTGADEPTTALTTVLTGEKPKRGKRIAVIAGVVVVVAALAATGVTLALRSGGEPGAADKPPVAPPSSSVPSSGPLGSAPQAEPSPSPVPEEAAAAFEDPELLAAAKPYLDRPDVRCKRAESIVSVRETVNCDLGSGIIASFRVLFFPKQLTALRKVLQTDNDGARPGSIRTLRWEYVPGQPGIRAGIPVGTPREGHGTRIRFLEPENGYARLYFDEDSTGVAVYMQAGTDDQQVLREFWADPDA
ncbi:hypothetical protein BS329_34235 [Amycolatopsis coloradensis]|uniref:Uncharacterized protein n=1 Tax=Amycolatopsis coloradensis TaxID=76021 RepID=A0A1R0KI95_9PSEU|nr:hypothetical protein [Amycolatopsis coloradensis]OLZ45475.1 hypothetical protein BS329_34235 [Amycolatopsis coloradensis]